MDKKLQEAIDKATIYLSSDTFDGLTSYWNDGGKLANEVKEILTLLKNFASDYIAAEGKVPEEKKPHWIQTGMGSYDENAEYNLGRKETLMAMMKAVNNMQLETLVLGKIVLFIRHSLFLPENTKLADLNEMIKIAIHTSLFGQEEKKEQV